MSRPIEYLSVASAKSATLVDLEQVNEVQYKGIHTIKHVRSRTLQCSLRDAINIAFNP